MYFAAIYETLLLYVLYEYLVFRHRLQHFAQKREALARDLGLAADTPLPTVIEAGLRAMGMVPAPGSIALQMVNTDQVPMPFVCDMEYTLDIKGAKQVAIN